jgi:diguanylate cyclase (GGDEF)-like protein
MTESLLPDGCLLSVATDITSLKRREHTLQEARDEALHASRTDVLTGVFNRRYILEVGEAALAKSQHASSLLSVAVLDLDHFKQINDTHGHHAGDEVLRNFASQCRRHLRPGDSLGRIGGEEFLLLLPGAGIEAADAVIDRLRAGLALQSGQTPYAFTFSAGLAEAQCGENLSALLKRGDAALYVAKHSGRNPSVAASAPSTDTLF